FGVKVPVKWPYTEIFHNIPYANHRCRRHLEQIASLQRIKDNEQDFVPAQDMLRELMSDNKAMIESMRSAHEVADAKGPPPRGPSPAVRPAVAAVIRLLS